MEREYASKLSSIAPLANHKASRGGSQSAMDRATLNSIKHFTNAITNSLNNNTGGEMVVREVKMAAVVVSNTKAAQIIFFATYITQKTHA